jgi:hypothetical protein
MASGGTHSKGAFGNAGPVFFKNSNLFLQKNNVFMF